MEDGKWTCANCGKKKENYNALYCNACWEEELASRIAPIIKK